MICGLGLAYAMILPPSLPPSFTNQPVFFFPPFLSTDEDTAKYLSTALPPIFGLSVSKIVDALRQLDSMNMPVFEERVVQALALALSTTTTTMTT